MPTLLPRLLRRAENTELPFSALPAILEIREHLDDLEIDAIRRARAKGATWEEIARALGVTRQALQQRLKRHAFADDHAAVPQRDRDHLRRAPAVNASRR